MIYIQYHHRGEMHSVCSNVVSVLVGTLRDGYYSEHTHTNVLIVHHHVLYWLIGKV